MGYINLHLETFEIESFSMNMESLFTLDDDIKDRAREILDEIDDHNEDDYSRINKVMQYINKSHGSFSTNFDWRIENIEGGYVIAVAYNY